MTRRLLLWKWCFATNNASYSSLLTFIGEIRMWHWLGSSITHNAHISNNVWPGSCTILIMSLAMNRIQSVGHICFIFDPKGYTDSCAAFRLHNIYHIPVNKYRGTKSGNLDIIIFAIYSLLSQRAIKKQKQYNCDSSSTISLAGPLVDVIKNT